MVWIIYVCSLLQDCCGRREWEIPSQILLHLVSPAPYAIPTVHLTCYYHSEDKSYSRPVNFSGTSNLKRHADHCNNLQAEQSGKKQGLKQARITSKIPPKFNKGFFRAKLVSWVTRSHRPDLAIKDEDLVDIFTYLNPDAQPPSRRTLRRDIHTTYKITKQEVKQMLAEHPGRFNPIFDCWSAGNGHEFLGILVSFRRGHECLLECIRPEWVQIVVQKTIHSHSGVHLCRNTR